ncbi:3-phosphoserine/phosphohydroxythreonine transaminase [Collinsella sp. zg1085]|uniref:3-phosphoserine/phosphohydroxythreonine transaminase n=1 Tax=Collinsella sp. zg1085 TaxID=2844380 RepID=UPI001C0BAE00|nr:3-phosphoserine/phosphohydroxythreonine transaminase [Collinsella sp. zg1085]QWT17176.1 3-phosphoserine/phosphohydroxythreonine transaminase [Collinsella sp. zg1085]
MQRKHIFNAGPAALPQEVLREVQDNLLNYDGSGMSILEMSHRSQSFQSIIDDAEASLRRLLKIPARYRVLFLQGGATLQFAGIPLNLMKTGQAGYVISGNFAKKAWQEAQKYGEAHVLASTEQLNFAQLPTLADIEGAAALQPLDYVYMCLNNTIFGTAFYELPYLGNTPLVADVSSCFLSAPFDIERFDLLYAGAQKNAGPAGVTIVIVRDELIAKGAARADICPSYMNYHIQAQQGSLYNTPNTFGIYVAGLVFRWIEQFGGLEAIAAHNRAKARALYDFLDSSPCFYGTAEKNSRSWMNVTFRAQDDALEAAVLAGADAAGIVGIRGHRLVGGMRASLYNAVSMESVQALINYLKSFE